MVSASPLEALTQATDAVFKTWTALQLTVEVHLGGDRHRAQQFLDDTIALITAAAPVCSEDGLVDFFVDQFDRMQADIQDGSPRQVARQVIRIRNALANGDFSPAALAIDAAARNNPAAFQESVDGGDAMACCNDDTDGGHACGGPSAPPPVVDDDGFTMVSHKPRGNKVIRRQQK